jgi:DNA (cytosine-5)-methyltransferase 1
MTAYYNENDAYASNWLRNLIEAGHIAPGIVDDRSVNDVRASDLAGFTQCHFFAGIGIWSRALRDAGWPDDRPVWTGSCPCQPFSGAGQRRGRDDERHLWPVWCDLIRECGPGTVIGEQVASPDALDWLDHVQADMEDASYAFAAVDMGAAGIGAPHWRQRLWWVANAHCKLQYGRGAGNPNRRAESANDSGAGELANADSNGCGEARQHLAEAWDDGAGAGRPGPVNGFWANADWIKCTDGKWRPVEPIHVKMVDGDTANMGRLCAYPENERENARVILQGLRQATHSETLFERGFREPLNDEKAKVLRSNMHGKRARERDLFEHQPQSHEINQAHEGCVRELRGGWISACASCGRKPAQQCTLELEDVVRLLPQSHSLAEFQCDGRTAGELSALQRAIYQAGMVRDASQPVQAVWASLGEEAKNRIRVGFDASRWKIVVPFPIASGVKGRVGKLRAYGNAICAPAATTFIKAVI